MTLTPQRPAPINLHEYEALAQTHLDPLAWDYIQGGSDDEVTLRANSAAYATIRLRPRVLVDVSSCRLDTTVLGTPVSMPVLIAPLGCQALAHADGECATARAAASADTLMVASTMATYSLEQIAASAAAPRWFQLYVYRNRSITEALIDRAAASGYRGLVVTVDTPQMGHRERDIRNGFGLPSHLRFANFEAGSSAHATEQAAPLSPLMSHAQASFDQTLSWRDLEWLRSRSSLPLLIKGILCGEDARLAVQHGVDGIIVSNHGGRQLDGTPATIEVLPEIVAAVDGRCEVFVDGGIRRGTDVLKALALGARAVLVGRPILWGLAAHGQAGVAHVLELLRSELALALALVGCPDIARIDRDRVRLPFETAAQERASWLS